MPTAQFLHGKISSSKFNQNLNKLPPPPPRDTMVKYPLPGIGLSIFYLLSLFLLNCEKIINPFHVSVSKQCANYSSCYNVCGPIGVEGVQTYNEEKE